MKKKRLKTLDGSIIYVDAETYRLASLYVWKIGKDGKPQRVKLRSE